jgi:hypothetical protein
MAKSEWRPAATFSRPQRRSTAKIRHTLTPVIPPHLNMV